MRIKYMTIITMIIFQLLVLGNVIYAFPNNKYSVTYDYYDNIANFIYFDVSEKRICISYENDKIYEYSLEGEFIRIINCQSYGNIYSYYIDNNLVVFDLRENLHMVIDDYGNCIETFKKEKEMYEGHYIGGDYSDNLELNISGYDIKYVNSNWFERIFNGKESEIIVSCENVLKLRIEEKKQKKEDIIPIICVLIIILGGYFIFKNKNIVSKTK